MKRTAIREHPNQPKPRDPFRNSRGKLHGEAALQRVLGSVTLRRRALEGVKVAELLREIRRRYLQLEEAHAQVHLDEPGEISKAYQAVVRLVHRLYQKVLGR